MVILGPVSQPQSVATQSCIQNIALIVSPLRFLLPGLEQCMHQSIQYLPCHAGGFPLLVQ